MDFGRIKQVCRRIPSPVDTLFSAVSAPVFLFVGHGVGQNAILVSCLLWARALSCSKVGFLTEYAELGKMRSGAVAKTAVGHSLEKGGDAVGTRTMDEGPSFSDLFSHGPLDHGLHSPKSVLTARRPPSG